MQIEKLGSDARRLGLAAPPAPLLAAEARGLAQGCERGILKMVLTRSAGGRGYRAAETGTDRLLCRYAAPGFPAGAWEQGIRATRSGFRLASQPALAGIKHLNRLEQVLASRDWPEGVDEAIVDDAAGRPLGGTRSNLFWVAGGTLRTPALDQCGVAGLMRDKVLAAATACGMRAHIAPGSWDELLAAGEVFVTNSVVGLWPVAQLDAQRWRAPGPVTRRLAEHLRHPRLEAA